MPLDMSKLEKGIKDNIDKAESSGDASYADLVTAVQTYALGLQFPPATGVMIGAELLKELLNSIPQNPPLPSVPIVKMAIKMFTLGIQMGWPANPADLSAVPTVAPAGLPPIDFLANPNPDADAHAKQLASAIDGWFRTGTYDIGVAASGTPNPVIVPWS